MPPPSAESAFVEDIRTARQEALFHVLLAGILALAVTAGVFLILAAAFGAPLFDGILGSVSEAGLPRAAAVLLSRSVIQPLNCFLAMLGVFLLSIRFQTSRREWAAFSLPFFEGMPRGTAGEIVLDESTVGRVLETAQSLARNYAGAVPLLIRRFEVGSFRLSQGGTVDQTQNVLAEMSRIDREKMEGGYTPLQYLVWVIPTLGFLGTVLGMGTAIAGFSEVVSSASGGTANVAESIRPVLGNIAHDLGTAFDTTLLALLLSALLVAMTSVVRSRDESLLAGIDELCVREFLSRIQLQDPATRAISQSMAGIGNMLQASLRQLAAPEHAAGRGPDLNALGDTVRQIAAAQQDLLGLMTQTAVHAEALANTARRMELRLRRDSDGESTSRET